MGQRAVLSPCVALVVAAVVVCCGATASLASAAAAEAVCPAKHGDDGTGVHPALRELLCQARVQAPLLATATAGLGDVPSELSDWLDAGGNHSRARDATPDPAAARGSSVTLGWRDAIPRPAGWTTCTQCALENGRVTLFDPSGALLRRLVPGASTAGSRQPELVPGIAHDMLEQYFGAGTHARFDAVVVPHAMAPRACDRVVRGHSYLLPVLHEAGHALMDLYESLHAMVR